MTKVLVMTNEKWLDLKNHGQYISGLELVGRLDAAMTEVDLEGEASELREAAILSNLGAAGYAHEYASGVNGLRDKLVASVKRGRVYTSCPNNSTNHCGEYLSCAACWAAHIKEGKRETPVNTPALAELEELAEARRIKEGQHERRNKTA